MLEKAMSEKERSRCWRRKAGDVGEGDVEVGKQAMLERERTEVNDEQEVMEEKQEGYSGRK